LGFVGFEVDELGGGLIAGGTNADFLGAGQILVAFEAGFGAQLWADGGIDAGLADGAPEGEQFGGAGVDFSCWKKAAGKPARRSTAGTEIWCSCRRVAWMAASWGSVGRLL
jgi:hypothetical protein